MNSTPLRTLDGISSESLVREARTIVELVSTWKPAAHFKYRVPQCPDKVVVDVRVNDLDDYWVARVNDFCDVPSSDIPKLWQDLIQYSIGSTESLETCHTVFEENYIEEIFQHKLAPYTLPQPAAGYECLTYLSELFYNLQWPLKVRRFCNLVHVVKSPDEKEAFVISLAIDPSLFPSASPRGDFVDAQFSSVERVSYDGTNLQWIMATCSNANALIPAWIVKKALNSAVAKDVPSFMTWVLQQP